MEQIRGFAKALKIQYFTILFYCELLVYRVYLLNQSNEVLILFLSTSQSILEP